MPVAGLMLSPVKLSSAVLSVRPLHCSPTVLSNEMTSSARRRTTALSWPHTATLSTYTAAAVSVVSLRRAGRHRSRMSCCSPKPESRTACSMSAWQKNRLQFHPMASTSILGVTSPNCAKEANFGSRAARADPRMHGRVKRALNFGGAFTL